MPPDTEVETGWRALTVAGPIDFAMTGVLASLAAPLAARACRCLAVATYDTDHVLVRADDLDRAGRSRRWPCDPDAAAPGRQRVASGSPFEPRIGFSRALRAGGRVLVSGTGPVMPDGCCPETTLEQARRCWEIVLAALAETGAGAADVVRTRTLLTPDADAEGAMQPTARCSPTCDPPRPCSSSTRCWTRAGPSRSKRRRSSSW